MSRIERVEMNGRAAWRKRYADEGRHLRLKLFSTIVNWLGAPALLPCVPQTAEQAWRTEQSMIARLAAAKLRVPEILHSEPNCLVLSDMGMTLAGACRNAQGDEDRLSVIAAGFVELLRAHQAGVWLNQGFSRNLTYSDGHVGFIDLDQDPRTVMSLADAQARDLLFYVYSTARFVISSERYTAALAAHLRSESETVRRVFEVNARALLRLRKLDLFFGRELKAMMRALHEFFATSQGR